MLCYHNPRGRLEIYIVIKNIFGCSTEEKLRLGNFINLLRISCMIYKFCLQEVGMIKIFYDFIRLCRELLALMGDFPINVLI